uniref:Uncharacterized protein n=1 Tax=Heterorhabditis bacteriophora TaxID=37862 RepID=A0A1I7WQI7_HETBA
MTQYMLLLLFIVYNVKGEMKNSAEPHFTTLINASVLEDSSQYSFPPNNTPVTKVYVFGRPVYIRQPFVLPQRNRINEKSLIALHGTSAYGKIIIYLSHTYLKLSFLKKLIYLLNIDKIRYHYSQIFYPLPSPDRFQYPKPKTIFRDSYNFEPEPYIKPKNNYPLPQCYTNDSATKNNTNIINKQCLCRNLIIEEKSEKEKVNIIFFLLLFPIYIGAFNSRFMLSYATPNRHQPPKYPTSAPNPYETPTIEPTKPYKN